jgi:antitoxin PrlF
MKAHPSVSRTLELLAADMNAFPERMLPMDMRLFDRITSLVGQADVDLNTPLFAEDE